MTPADGPLVVERRIQASPETVFGFFADPRRWLQWQGLKAELDPRPGGVFRMNVRGDGWAVGRFLEVDPPRRIVFTWGWEIERSPLPPGSSVVEVELIPQGDGTLVSLKGKPIMIGSDTRAGASVSSTSVLGRESLRARRSSSARVCSSYARSLSTSPARPFSTTTVAPAVWDAAAGSAENARHVAATAHTMRMRDASTRPRGRPRRARAALRGPCALI